MSAHAWLDDALADLLVERGLARRDRNSGVLYVNGLAAAIADSDRYRVTLVRLRDDARRRETGVSGQMSPLAALEMADAALHGRRG